jgi:hypothetical protein
MAVDMSGNVYVTGWGGSDGATMSDWATMKYDSSGNRIWVARYDGPASRHDFAYAIAVDSSGNVYVTGTCDGNQTVGDYATIKYDGDGNQLWVAHYDGPGSDGYGYGPRDRDFARDIAVDGSGNVYVTGESSDDYATIKYDSAGNQVWVARHEGSGSMWAVAEAMALDGLGNVYVTGRSANDCVTVKYDSAGSQVWVARYDGPAGGSDSGEAIALDSSGNVYVTGYSIGVSSYEDYATIKYDSAGNQLWVARYDGPQSFEDQPRAIAVDASGNAYVTGFCWASLTAGTDYATVKYDSAGNQLWVARYDGPAVDPEPDLYYADVASALALDACGNVYVTGGSQTNRFHHSTDFATVKYDSTGNQLWVARYDYRGPGGPHADEACDIALDDSGNVYVAGLSGCDFATIKYAQSAQDCSSFPAPESSETIPALFHSNLIRSLTLILDNHPVLKAIFEAVLSCAWRP